MVKTLTNYFTGDEQRNIIKLEKLESRNCDRNRALIKCCSQAHNQTRSAFSKSDLLAEEEEYLDFG